MVNLSRFLKVDAENALEKTNKKFMKRFNFMEAEAQKLNKQLHNMNLQEMEELWIMAKKQQ